MWLLILVFVQKSLQHYDERTTPVEVNRRLTGDIEYLDHKFNGCNDGTNVTYLVEERQCVSDQDLLKGKQIMTVVYLLAS